MIPYRKRALEERYRVHWGHLEPRRDKSAGIALALAAAAMLCTGGVLFAWL